MHGVRKLPPGALDEAKRLSQAKKLKAYKQLFSSFISSRKSNNKTNDSTGDDDSGGVKDNGKITDALLSVNPEVYSAWNDRRKSANGDNKPIPIPGVFIGKSFNNNNNNNNNDIDNNLGNDDNVNSNNNDSKNDDEEEIGDNSGDDQANTVENTLSFSATATKELSMSLTALTQNPKSYWVWFHRRYILSHRRLPDSERHRLLLKEIANCERLHAADDRNFHCWSHWAWCNRMLEAMEIAGNRSTDASDGSLEVTKISNDDTKISNNDDDTKISTKISNDDEAKISSDDDTKISNDDDTKISNDDGAEICNVFNNNSGNDAEIFSGGYDSIFSDKAKRERLQRELGYTMERIERNFSNYSAWHRRSVAASQLADIEKRTKFNKDNNNKKSNNNNGDDDDDDDDDDVGDMISFFESEVETVCQAFYTEPDDQSAWMYHRWVIRAMISAKSNSFINDFNDDDVADNDDVNSTSDSDMFADNDRIVTTVTKCADGTVIGLAMFDLVVSPEEMSTEVIFYNSNSDGNDNSNNDDNSKTVVHSGRWIAIPCGFGTTSLRSNLLAYEFNDNNSDNGGIDESRFDSFAVFFKDSKCSANKVNKVNGIRSTYDNSEDEVISREIESMRSLLEVEPRSKWPTLTLASLIETTLYTNSNSKCNNSNDNSNDGGKDEESEEEEEEYSGYSSDSSDGLSDVESRRDAVISLVSDLIDIDPMRVGYYKHWRTNLIIDREISKIIANTNINSNVDDDNGDNDKDSNDHSLEIDLKGKNLTHIPLFNNGNSGGINNNNINNNINNNNNNSSNNNGNGNINNNIRNKIGDIAMKVSKLDVSSNEITSLDFLPVFANLEEIDASDNAITAFGRGWRAHRGGKLKKIVLKGNKGLEVEKVRRILGQQVEIVM